MKQLVAVLAGALLAAASGSAQGRGVFGGGAQYGSTTGFGSVLYPGTGHAPLNPPGAITNANFGRGLARTVGPGGFYGNPRQVAHPQHGRTVVVPYPIVVGGAGYYGGLGYDGNQNAPGYGQDPANSGMPSVVINQNFIPERMNPVVREYSSMGSQDVMEPPQSSGLRVYETTPTHPYDNQTAAPASDGQPTLYLLAFTDHNIVPSLAYWVEGRTLHYINVEHTMNQVSLDLVDRELSQRLNDERKIDFHLSR